MNLLNESRSACMTGILTTRISEKLATPVLVKTAPQAGRREIILCCKADVDVLPRLSGYLFDPQLQLQCIVVYIGVNLQDPGSTLSKLCQIIYSIPVLKTIVILLQNRVRILTG